MREVQGVSFPAVIHNESYYLTDIFVYEDGVIDCWGMADLASFKREVQRGWVVPQIPDGERLKIHDLGWVQVTKAKWTMRPRDLVERVKGIVAELNPRGRNLYRKYDDATDGSGGFPTLKLQNRARSAWKFEDPDDPLSRKITGGTTKYSFMRYGDSIRLVQICVFADETVKIIGLDEAVDIEFDELTSLIREGSAFDGPKSGQKVIINGLGEFVAGAANQFIDADGLIGELTSLQQRAKGLPDLIEICRDAYADYCEEPSRKNLKALREAYEAVPAHMRRYCGDMDTKDTPIKMALRGEK